MEIGLTKIGRIYVDSRGWKYRVMGGTRSPCFIIGYLKPGSKKWHRWQTSTRYVQYRETFEEAEDDLIFLANRNGWKLCKEADG